MSNKSEKAMIIGFVVILAIFVFSFYRPEIDFDKILSIFKKTEQTETEEEKFVPTYSSISVAEMKDLMTKYEEKTFVVDIRESSDYEIIHILGSINLPYSKMTDTPTKINKSGIEQVVIVGYGDQDVEVAERMVNKIIDGGIKNVKVLSAGFSEWEKTGLNLISWGDPNSFVEQSKVSFIKAEDLNNLLNNNSYLFIIDLRDGSDFKSEHLPKAVNIPLEQLEGRRNEVPKSKNIIVYSDNELEAYQAGVKLYDMRFPLTQVYKEGISDWKSKNFPVEK